MRFTIVIIAFGLFVLSSELHSQNIFPLPGPGNAGVGTGPGPLNLMHLHGTGDNLPFQPVLRFSYGDLANGQPFVTNDQPIAQLALPRTNANALIFSQQALQGDFVIRTTQNSGRLILSTQKPGSPILFTTSIIATTPVVDAIDYTLVSISNGTEMPARNPTQAPPPGSINGRMTTSPGVHLGVECADPKDAVQVGSRLTLHPGYNFNYIGYNQSTNSSGQLIRLTGTVDATDNPLATPPVESGHAAGLAFMRSGEAILYSAGENGVGTPVQIWQQPEWFYRGITVAPDGLVGVGLMAPKPTSSPVDVATSRLTIRGPLGQNHSYGSGTSNTFSINERTSLYSLRVMTGDASDIFCVREDRRVGVGTLQPRDIVQIGNEIVVHDGGSKGLFLNAYYDTPTNSVKNVVSTRPSVFFGVDPVGQSYDGGLAISVTRSTSAEQTIFPSSSTTRGQYRGLRLLANGSAGIGEYFPEARLDVRGLTGSSMDIFLARSVQTTGQQGYLVVTADGKVGVNTQSPKGAFHVNGDVTIGVNQCTNAHAGFTNKLSVDGIIFTKEVRVVPSTWADDVFRSDYRLPTLTQVEEHIKQHGHLAGIPSEAQATKEGVDVSVMQASLLRKIEELTLYVIELEKKINALKGE